MNRGQKQPHSSVDTSGTAPAVLVAVEYLVHPLLLVLDTGGLDSTLILGGNAEHSPASLLARCNTAPQGVPPAKVPPGP